MIRIIAVLSLMISGIFAITIEKFGQGLCVYQYLSPNSVTYLRDLYGVSSNDDVMIEACGYLSIIIGSVLLLIRNSKVIYSITLIILVAFEILLLNMMDTMPYKEIIYDSIAKCANYSVLGWTVLQFVFLILSGIYLFKNK